MGFDSSAYQPSDSEGEFEMTKVVKDITQQNVDVVNACLAEIAAVLNEAFSKVCNIIVAQVGTKEKEILSRQHSTDCRGISG
jgi:hypothetical protein